MSIDSTPPRRRAGYWPPSPPSPEPRRALPAPATADAGSGSPACTLRQQGKATRLTPRASRSYSAPSGRAAAKNGRTAVALPVAELTLAGGGAPRPASNR